MDVLQRVSTEVLRGGVRLNLVPGTVPTSVYVSMSNRFGRVCCMASKPAGPLRYMPSGYAQEEKTNSEAQKSSKTSTPHVEGCVGCSSDVPLETEADRWDDVALGAVNSSKTRRPKEGTATSCRLQRMDTKQGREVPKGAVLNLTYANGRKVETTLLDALGTLEAGNDEQSHTPDKGLVRSSSTLFKSVSEHVGLENLGFELTGAAPVRHEEIASAKDYALSLLAAAPQPVANLRRKLSSRHVSSLVIEKIIQDLQRGGLQSDREFAESFARSRWRSLSWGPSRIKYELERRGVGAEDIQGAMKKVFESANVEDGPGGDNEETEVSTWGMTSQARDHLLKQAQRRWQKAGPSVTHEARKRRMVGWLQRRGYGWPIITDVMKFCEEHQPEAEWDE